MSKLRLTLLLAAVLLAATLIGWDYLYLVLSLAVAIVAFAAAAKFIWADRLEAKKSRARAPTLADAVRGRAITRDDWIPDARVQGGMVYNKREGRIEIAGKLSDDSLDRVFR